MNATREEMFVPVPIADVIQDMDAGRDTTREYRTPSGVLLRPSVETSMHAVMPHPVVIHLHSVRTIAWAVQSDDGHAVAERLQGLRWCWIPYIHPGFPLAGRIQQELDNRPDVLILENHGLVVGAEHCTSAMALVSEVERRACSIYACRIESEPTETGMGQGRNVPLWRASPRGGKTIQSEI